MRSIMLVRRKPGNEVLEYVGVDGAVGRVRPVAEPVDKGLRKPVLEVASRMGSGDFLHLVRGQSVQPQPDHVGEDTEVGGGDFVPHPAGNPGRGVKRDGRPDHLGGGVGETAIEQELTSMICSIELEPLLDGRVGSEEAGIVEERRDVEQLGVGLQAEFASLEHAEEEDAPRMMEQQGVRRFPDDVSGFGCHLGLRYLYSCNDLGHGPALSGFDVVERTVCPFLHGAVYRAFTAASVRP